MISDETVLQAVTIGKDVVAPEGACLWLAEHMLQVVSKVGKYAAGWLSQKHNASGDLPATEMNPAAFAVGPKEDLATITSSFSTFIEFYEKRDVGLMSVVLRYILMDGCAAGRLAAEKARWGQGK